MTAPQNPSAPDSPEGGGAFPDASTAGSSRGPTDRTLKLAAAAGLLAGVLAWAAGECTYGAFKPRLVKISVMAMSSMQPTAQTEAAAGLNNATLSFALLGSITGAVLGATGAVVRRRVGRAAIAVPVGLVAGGLAAAAAAVPLLTVYYRQYVPDGNDLIFPLLIHGGIATPVGAAAGLAFGLGLGGGPGRLAGAVLGGCLGAVLASALFEAVGAGLFPDSGTAEPLPTSWAARLLARVLVTLLTALGAARGVLGPEPRSDPVPVSSVPPRPAGGE